MNIIILTSIFISTGFGYKTLRKDFDIKRFDNLKKKNTQSLETINNLEIKRLNREHVIDNELEAHTKNFIETHHLENTKISDYNDINIPVVFHVIYNDGDKYNLDDYNLGDTILTEENLQVGILDQLNKDFNMKNDDINDTPDEWKDILGDFKITFSIKMIKYISSNKKEWDINNDDWDKMKFDKYGGSDVINPELNLNIWIVLIPEDDNGLITLGYAQFPGQFKDSPETDGYVLNVLSLYLLDDRTSTHEIGHWMNLRHIWGDGGCEDDDLVDDTPVSNTNHIECGSSVECVYPTTSSCGSADMFMNFMSYGSETCMFTEGQMLRARAVFEKGGTRYSIVTQEKSSSNTDVVIGLAIFFVILIGIGIVSYIVFTRWLKITVSRRHVILDNESPENSQIELGNSEIELENSQIELENSYQIDIELENSHQIEGN